MRISVLFLFLSLIAYTHAVQNTYTVLWKLHLHKESAKNKYSFSEISEYIYNISQDKTSIFYTDSLCKNKLNKNNFTQHLFEKNQSVAGYIFMNVQEDWKFTPEGIISKVTFLSFENPDLPQKDPYRTLYVSQKSISTVLKNIIFSEYYKGRADVPLGEWIKKHNFEYILLKTVPTLPQPPYKFQYNKTIDDTTYKKIQILFDFFPENNKVFNRTYKRDNNVLESLSYLHTYSNEAQSALFRNTLLDALQKNKLIKSSPEIEDVLQNNTANYVFYFEGIYSSIGLEWTAIRVYISSGVHSAVPQLLCANIPKNKIKVIDAYFKKNSGNTFTEYFTKIKIDFLVSYINNTYAKNTEEGLMLRDYLFGF
jgi:hypothetical protein